MVLLRFQALRKNDAPVRVALETVEDLCGVRGLRCKRWRPRLRPRRLKCVDRKPVACAERVRPSEAAARVLECPKARRLIVDGLNAVADEVEVPRVGDLELGVVLVRIRARGGED
jgi:hypothetical protein